MDERKRLEQERRALRQERKRLKRKLGYIERKRVRAEVELNGLLAAAGAIQPRFQEIFPGRGPLKKRLLMVLDDQIEKCQAAVRLRPRLPDEAVRYIVDQAMHTFTLWHNSISEGRTIKVAAEQVREFYWPEQGDMDEDRFFFEEARVPFSPTWFTFGPGFPVKVASWPRGMEDEHLRAVLVDIDEDELHLTFCMTSRILEGMVYLPDYPNFTMSTCASTWLGIPRTEEEFDFSDCPLLLPDHEGWCSFPYGRWEEFGEACPPSQIKGTLLRMTVLLLAFVNARNVELEYVDPYADKRGQARGKGRKWPDAWYEVRINTDGLRTASESTGEGPRNTYIYDVRGHFRRLTHERYRRDEDGYVRVIWIPAHLRGLASGGPYIPSVRRVAKKGV